MLSQSTRLQPASEAPDGQPTRQLIRQPIRRPAHSSSGVSKPAQDDDVAAEPKAVSTSMLLVSVSVSSEHHSSASPAI